MKTIRKILNAIQKFITQRANDLTLKTFIELERKKTIKKGDF